MPDSPFTIRHECPGPECNYLELWKNNYKEWLRKCAGCQRPFREGWLKVHNKGGVENGHEHYFS